jgi:excisionase family DNA binding protein
VQEDWQCDKADILMKTYFIASSTAIKIGVSQNPFKRMARLQTSHDEKLEVLGVLNGNREAEIHGLFPSLRLQGEWFRIAPPLVKWIQDNVAPDLSGTAEGQRRITWYQEEGKRWLNVKEAAEYVSCSVWAIQQLIRDGKLPYRKVGRRFVVDRIDLDRYLESISSVPILHSMLADLKKGEKPLGPGILSEKDVQRIRMKYS